MTQFLAPIARGTASLTGFAVAPAITLTSFPQFTFVLAGAPELLTLAAATAASEADTARPDFDPLGEG